MKLLLDEMHAPAVVAALTDEGWDVLALAANRALRGMPDAELLAHATAGSRALVTENIVDYTVLAREWAIEGRTHAGLVFTSPKRFDRAKRTYPGDLIAALRGFLQDPPATGPSAIWWL